MKKLRIAQAVMVVAALVAFPAAALGASNSTFNQTINSGTLTTDILDASGNAVGSPAVSMSAKNFSFDCQAGVDASAGTFGSASERIYVNNGDAADNGWTLTVAATDGATAAWENSGSTATFDFNDATGSTAGCSDGADTDSVAGQMTLDPSAGTLAADCSTCSTTNVSKGSSASFEEGTTDNVTLLNAASGSDDVFRGYLTDVGVSQTIPAETPADSYTIDLTLTVTAS